MRRERRRYFKAEARRLLGGQNLFALIMASLLLIMMSVAWQVIVDGFFASFTYDPTALDPPTEQSIDLAYKVIDLLGFLMLLMPLWYGLRLIAWTAVTGQESGVQAEPAQLFAAFASPRSLMRVWRASLWILWRFALSFGLIWGMWYGVGLLAALLPTVWYVLLCAGAVVLTPVLLIPLVGTQLVYPLLIAAPTLGVFGAVRASLRIAFRSFGETLLFWCSFLPWFALAFATGGVMLVLYVLPYFILADTLYAGFRLALERPVTISTKEINHVQ